VLRCSPFSAPATVMLIKWAQYWLNIVKGRVLEDVARDAVTYWTGPSGWARPAPTGSVRTSTKDHRFVLAMRGVVGGLVAVGSTAESAPSSRWRATCCGSRR
jgi:hypothetical protein